MGMRSEGARRASQLRWAAAGGAAFVVSYSAHRLLQGAGPEGTDAAAVSEWIVAQRGALLASEIALGVALLAFLGFVAPLVDVLQCEVGTLVAAGFAVAGAVFIAMGLVSNAAETALFSTDGRELVAIEVLDGLQRRIPNVLAAAMLGGALAPAFLRGALAWRWVGFASVAAAALFFLGYVFGVVGSNPESGASVFGVAIFVIWMALVCTALWVTARREDRVPNSTPAGNGELK